MAAKTTPFVITDRRKFTTEGEARPDADPSPEREPRPIGPPSVPEPPVQPDPENSNTTPGSTEPGKPSLLPQEVSSAVNAEDAAAQPPAPTAEQMEQSRAAFQATSDRLDTAVRAANPGMDHPPAMSFDQLVQSVYMQTVLQLGGGTEEGQQPQVDLLGARQSIDMLGILEEKTRGNLNPTEETFLTSALFELRLAFLEMTQALARSAQQRGTTGPAGPPVPASGGGPRIVR